MRISERDPQPKLYRSRVFLTCGAAKAICRRLRYMQAGCIIALAAKHRRSRNV
jgi:hypothetical protein